MPKSFDIILLYTVAASAGLVDQMSHLKIIAGHDAKPHSAPWIVSIQLYQDFQWFHICGGSIITAEWILTSAQCTIGCSWKSLQIYAGRHHILAQTESCEQRRNVNRIHIHETFNSISLQNDISLVRTASPFQLSAAVQSLNIPTNDIIPDGTARIYGWGSTADDPVADILQMVKQPIQPLDICRNIFHGSSYLPPIYSSNMCTGTLIDGDSACHGDGGGPVVQKNLLIGIISWGWPNCGLVEGSPLTVSVRVSVYIDWIYEKISHKI